MALEATVGVPVSLDVWTAAGFTSSYPVSQWEQPEGVPPGLEFVAATKTLDGTPTHAGTYTVTVYTDDPHSNPIPGTVEVKIVAATVPDPDPDPEPGDPEPGDPEAPELDPFDLYGILARSLAPRVAAFVGRPDDEDTIATAEAQIPVVTEYVRGYTRGRGFDDEAPAGPLRAVIVSGVARLATNPEQVQVFTTGDYSERPAQLAGWTLTELGVLRRYRRTSA